MIDPLSLLFPAPVFFLFFFPPACVKQSVFYKTKSAVVPDLLDETGEILGGHGGTAAVAQMDRSENRRGSHGGLSPIPRVRSGVLMRFSTC